MEAVIPLHDAESTKSFKKEFGVFIGLYNKINNTKISVREALKIDKLVLLFERLVEIQTKAHVVIKNSPVIKNKGSIKLRSYSMLDIPKIDEEVLAFIKKHPKKSRSEIADELCIRLQTICGACRRLIDNDYVFVSGEKIDLETRRHVEVLESR